LLSLISQGMESVWDRIITPIVLLTRIHDLFMFPAYMMTGRVAPRVFS